MIHMVHGLVETAQAADNLYQILRELKEQYKDAEIPDWLRDALSFMWTIQGQLANISAGIDELLEMVKEGVN